MVRLGGVTQAYVQYFRASQEGAPVVLVLPGGGYQILAADIEGAEIARWLQRQGINAVVLLYRVPTAAPHAEPLADAQAALDMIRGKAAQWHADARRLGVIGFSAGGDLTARLTASRPGVVTAQMLIYPAYLAAKGEALAVRAEVAPGPRTPPTFLVQTERDPVDVRNSLAYYVALQKLGVPAELHLYERGMHGYGLRPDGNAVTGWPEPAQRWLERNLVGAAAIR